MRKRKKENKIEDRRDRDRDRQRERERERARERKRKRENNRSIYRDIDYLHVLASGIGDVRSTTKRLQSADDRIERVHQRLSSNIRPMLSTNILCLKINPWASHRDEVANIGPH